MWDYDKLFAKGNIVGFKHNNDSEIHPYLIYEQNDCMDYFNDSLSYNSKNSISKIQYIICLDEHGNVVEKLFDREKDMLKSMPELKTGMFVRVNSYGDSKLGFIDAEHNHVVYQEGGYDFINNDGMRPGVSSKIVEVYSKDTCGFNFCYEDVLIWRKPEYQEYLDSKHN